MPSYSALPNMRPRNSSKANACKHREDLDKRVAGIGRETLDKQGDPEPQRMRWLPQRRLYAREHKGGTALAQVHTY